MHKRDGVVIIACHYVLLGNQEIFQSYQLLPQCPLTSIPASMSAVSRSTWDTIAYGNFKDQHQLLLNC